MDRIYPQIARTVAKAGGLQRQGAKGAAVVKLLQALGNAGYGVLRLLRLESLLLSPLLVDGKQLLADGIEDKLFRRNVAGCAKSLYAIKKCFWDVNADRTLIRFAICIAH